jgi:pyruvate/2-oxoglutarate dehydrogenase complex dihydrolipoamide acyltransferase (E2) component
VIFLPEYVANDYFKADGIDFKPGVSVPASIVESAPHMTSMVVTVPDPPEATPKAEEVAEARNLDPDHVMGSGKEGKVTAPDVKSEEEPDATEGARERARELGVPLNTVAGTGSEGRITTSDVEKEHRRTS